MHRHYNNPLPEDVYTMTVVGAEPKPSEVTEREYWDVVFVLDGTDRIEHRFLSSRPSAEWAWKQFPIEKIEDLPTLSGRRFMVDYRHELYEGQKRGVIKSILAEVIKED